MRTEPWVVCPVCWCRIDIPSGTELDEHECANPTCPLSSNRVKLRLFPTKEHAQAALGRNGGIGVVIRGPVKCTDINEQPLDYWAVFFCTRPVERFRLLEGPPLARLLPVRFIADWSSGVAQRWSRAFTVFLLSYDRTTGQVRRRASDGNVDLIPADPAPVSPHSPLPACYTSACAFVGRRCIEAVIRQPPFDDPCLKCNSQLVSSFFDANGFDPKLLPLTAVDPSDPQSDVLFRVSHHLCWAGFLDMAYPVIVAGVMVGVVFTGQLRVKDPRLSNDQCVERRRILGMLGISEEAFLRHYAEAQATDLAEVRRGLWSDLRMAAQELQEIAVGRYGQMSAVRAGFLSEQLRSKAAAIPILSRTKWDILSQIADRTLGDLADFFSFKRAALVVRDAERWQVAAAWPPRKLQKPVELPADFSADGSVASAHLVLGTLWTDYDNKWPVYSVSPDDTYVYVFGDRRFSNNQPRKGFNRFSRDLLEELTRALNRQIGLQMHEHQRIEAIRDIIHNLGSPMTGIESALASFNASVYERHAAEMSILPGSFRFIEGAIEGLVDNIERARRRAGFEIRKFRGAIGIQQHLKKRRYNIPLVDNRPSLTIGPEGLWDRTLWALGMYASELKESAIQVGTTCLVGQDMLRRDHVQIDRDALQIVIENMIDNAVKYAYGDSTLRIRLQIQPLREIVEEINIAKARETGYSSLSLQDERIGRDAQKEYVTLSTDNYGNGILKTEFARICERFYRGMRSSTNRHTVQGTGLGMFILKTIMDDYEGFIRITSDFGGEKNYNLGEGFRTVVMISLPVFHA